MATHTERKHCDQCSEETVWIKGTPGECIHCQFKGIVTHWQQEIATNGLAKAKQDWENTRNDNTFQEIKLELTPADLVKWNEAEAKANALFTPQNNKHTERKHCDECNKETAHSKNDDSCLPCFWKTLETEWKERIKNNGLEETKRAWKELQNSQQVQEIKSELTPDEKTQWNSLETTLNKLFTPTPQKKDKQEQPFNWTSYLIGGGILVVGIIVGLVVYFNYQKKKEPKKTHF